MRPRHYYSFASCYLRNKIGIVTPFLAVFRVTFRCNLKCVFCNIWKKEKLDEIGYPIYKEAVDDLRRMKVPYLNITGGEPLLKKDILKLGRYAIDKGIYVTFSTNATLIDSRIAKEFAFSADTIKISIDGKEKTHDRIRKVKGAYRMAVAGIENLSRVKGRRARIIIHMVATRSNILEMREVMQDFVGRADSFSIMPEFDIAKGFVFDDPIFRKEWKYIKERFGLQQSSEFIRKPSADIGKMYCDAGKYYFSVIPDGNVAVCPNGIAKIGNLRDRDLISILNTPYSEETKKKIRSCRGCFTRCTTEISMHLRRPVIKTLLGSYRMIRGINL